MTFNFGDRVIVTNHSWSNEHGSVVAQKFGRSPEGVAVRFDDYKHYLSETDYHSFSEDEVRLENYSAAPSTPTPTYYDFPGGVQVRDISAHLTSFGGQALQYVARATRLDGNNKGESVKDLRKAIDFIQWEIERLEAGND